MSDFEKPIFGWDVLAFGMVLAFTGGFLLGIPLGKKKAAEQLKRGSPS